VTIKETYQTAIALVGFSDFSVDLDEENRKITIFINEGDWFKKWVPQLVNDFSHISKVMSKKHRCDPVFIDVNNYRRERENIITDLAKAAARKVVVTKGSVKLPAMNAYERRLIHMELAMRPDVATESEGEGTDRCVIVKPLD